MCIRDLFLVAVPLAVIASVHSSWLEVVESFHLETL